MIMQRGAVAVGQRCSGSSSVLAASASLNKHFWSWAPGARQSHKAAEMQRAAAAAEDDAATSATTTPPVATKKATKPAVLPTNRGSLFAATPKAAAPVPGRKHFFSWAPGAQHSHRAARMAAAASAAKKAEEPAATTLGAALALRNQQFCLGREEDALESSYAEEDTILTTVVAHSTEALHLSSSPPLMAMTSSSPLLSMPRTAGKQREVSDLSPWFTAFPALTKGMNQDRFKTMRAQSTTSTTQYPTTPTAAATTSSTGTENSDGMRLTTENSAASD